MEKQPTNMDIDPDGKKIYVINHGSNFISVINKLLGVEEKRIEVGENPFGCLNLDIDYYLSYRCLVIGYF